MLYIKNVREFSDGGKEGVIADLMADGVAGDYNLWFSVDAKYKDGLCYDRVDAFVAGLIIWAIRKHHDITFEQPITDVLKDSIEHDFLSPLCQYEPNLFRPKLIGPTTAPLYKTKVVRGTGCSCGVDSLYTIWNRMRDEKLGERYLMVTNSHLRPRDDTHEDADRRWQHLVKNAQGLSDEIGVPLIVGDTNYENGSLPGLTVGNSTTYCNMFCALSLQNLFSHYYIASGGPIADFGSRYLAHGMFGADCSNYDLLTLQAFSLPNLKFVVDGLESRVDKVRALVGWSPAFSHLDVCMNHFDDRRSSNGTNDCEKCMHTVCEILVAGGWDCLERFQDVFDVGYVRSHKWQYLSEVMRLRLRGSEYGRDIWPLRGNMELAALDYVKAMLVILKKLFLKVVTLGHSSHSWSN